MNLKGFPVGGIPLRLRTRHTDLSADRSKLETKAKGVELTSEEMFNVCGYILRLHAVYGLSYGFSSKVGIRAETLPIPTSVW